PSRSLAQSCCWRIRSSKCCKAAALRILFCRKVCFAVPDGGRIPDMAGFAVELRSRLPRGLVRCRSFFGTSTWLHRFLCLQTLWLFRLHSLSSLLPCSRYWLLRCFRGLGLFSITPTGRWPH